MSSYTGPVEIIAIDAEGDGPHLPTEIDNLDSPSWTGVVSEEIEPAWGFVPGDVVVRLLEGDRAGEVARATVEAIESGQRARLYGASPFGPPGSAGE